MQEENGMIPSDGQASNALRSVPTPAGTAHSGFDRKIYPGSGNGNHTNP